MDKYRSPPETKDARPSMSMSVGGGGFPAGGGPGAVVGFGAGGGVGALRGSVGISALIPTSSGTLSAGFGREGYMAGRSNVDTFSFGFSRPW